MAAASLPVVTRGIVLRETLTKETDKILTVLTAEGGRLPVIARGARRRGCKFAACAQPLAYSELTLAHRGEWYYLREGTTLELFSPLRADLERMALGFYFAELTEAVTAEGEEAGELLAHLLNGLYALGTLKKPPELVKAAFELRLLCLAGYEPLTDECVCCGNPDPPDPLLDVVQGVVLCRTCREAGHTLRMPLTPAALTALRRITTCEAKRLYSFTLGEESLHRLAAAAEAFTAAQLERGFRTLDFYKGLQTPEPTEKAITERIKESERYKEEKNHERHV